MSRQTHNFPKPPDHQIKQALHYWIDDFDIDGHYFGRRILQWAPGAQQWCHSGDLGTDTFVYVSEYSKIVCKQDIPEGD